MKRKIHSVISLIICISILLCSSSLFAFADEGDITISRISLTVNGDASSSRGLCWYTDKECRCDLNICCGGVDVTGFVTTDYPDCFEFEGNFVHKATVTGLDAGKTYEYIISCGGKEKRGTFTTDDGDEKVDFLVVADVQAYLEADFQKAAYTVEKGISLGDKTDFIVNLGDFTNDSDNNCWDMYHKHFENIHTSNTLVPVSGNHDGLNRGYWFSNMFCLDTTESVQNINGVNYSFDYGNAHFAVLNTNDLLSISLLQLEWLKNDLNSTDRDWKIIFMHKSFYTFGKDGKWPDSTYLEKVLPKVLQECNADLVISGHDHLYMRSKKLINSKVNDDGITYVLGGTAGEKKYEIRQFLDGYFTKRNNMEKIISQSDGQYLENGEWLQFDNDYIGSCFNRISIDGGQLTFNSYILNDVKNPDGSDKITNIDSFEITKETGKNVPSFCGDNTTSFAEYIASAPVSFGGLAIYTIVEWLPKFLLMLPEYLYYVIKYNIY